MLVRLYELNPRQWLVLGVLGLIAGSMGWGIISPYFDETREQREHCDSLTDNVLEALKAANYCDNNEDCTQAALPCPFSCNNYINKQADVGKVEQSVQTYSEACGYCVEDCTQVAPVCVNRQCVSFATLPEKNNEHAH